MECFNIIFSGKLTSRASKNALPEILKSLKFSAAHIQHLKAGNSITLKKNLDSNQAIAMQKKLAKMGLKTHIELQLNPNCFELGYKEISKPSLEFSPAFVFDLRWLKSRILSMPGKRKILGSKGELLGYADQYMPRINPSARLFLSVATTLTLQFYLLLLLPHYIGSGMASTLSGVVFLFAGVLILPQLMRLLAIRCIRDKHGHIEGSIVDRPSVLPNATKHDLYDSGDRIYATVTVKKNEVRCHSMNGQLMYEWKPNIRIAADKDAVENISDSVLDDTIFGQINEYFENIRQVFQLFSRTPKIKNVQFPLNEASPIVDPYGNTVAAVFSNDLPAVRLSPQHQDAGFTLKAMTILAMERPLL